MATEGISGMPRYYFDLRDTDGVFADEDGLDLRDMEHAQDEAARFLADMARIALGKAHDDPIERITIEVRDDDGPVMNMRFTFEIERMR